jgi:hypothetical protein
MRSILFALAGLATAEAAIPIDVSRLRAGPVSVVAAGEELTVRWHDERGREWAADFSLDPAKPLPSRLAVAGRTVASGGRPFYWVETGKRRGGWDQFFDCPPGHPDGTRRFPSEFKPVRAVARTKGDRVEVQFEGLRLGIFEGGIAYTFYPGSRLIQQEAVAVTREPDTAYYYDAGFQWTEEGDRRAGGNMQSSIHWIDSDGHPRVTTPFGSERFTLQAKHRVAAARTAGGSIAVFAAPHQYFAPRDFTTNQGYLWTRSWRGQVALGLRAYPDDHSPFYPWMNAPPGTQQRMSLFLLAGDNVPTAAIEEVLRYTNRDRFPALPGYKVITSHWHYAYTVQAMEKGMQWVPAFKPVLRSLGVDGAIIADFHGDGHPQDTTDTRLRELEAYFKACRAQTDANFLLIPAEEANAHLGGHYMVVFPKPVYWKMQRAESDPFIASDPKSGTVYSTRNAADVFEMVKRENGLVYTAHPRTKGSMGFPDKYKETAFFGHPTFFGAGFKQMPADLSTLRQGLRALNLLDDMSNWGVQGGYRKRLISEVDVFQVDHTHELYAHMNVNYVRLDRLPDFANYGRVLDAIRKGDYFVSLGEVLLPTVTIRRSGSAIEARLAVKWSLPLSEGWLIWGDGKETYRERIPLEDTRAFGERTFDWRIEAPGAKWARVEVWDVAGSGGFVNPEVF